MPKKNYYEILGVPRTATEDDIKKRYRQLVRLHHPDVAQDKAAAKDAFLQIAEAYQTLINPDRRLIYDATMDTPSFRPQATNRPTSQRPTPQNPPRPRPSQQRQAHNTQPNRSAEIQRWMAEARKSFAQSQYRSAVYACREALKLDARLPEPHIILGDIYRIQGRTDEAVAMYSLAVQLDPRNADVQVKLDRLIRNEKVQTSSTGGEIPDRRTMLKMGLMLTIGSLAIISILVGSLVSAAPLPWVREHLVFVSSWSSVLIFGMLGAGVFMGLMLSLTDAVQPLDDELVFQSVRASGLKSVSYPVGLLLVILSLFNFYVASIVYFLIGWTQESISRSVVKVLGATLMLVVLGAIMYTPGHSQVLYFGGNVIFPSMLIGWTLGDMFRPGW